MAGYGYESLSGGLSIGTPVPTQTPADKATLHVISPTTVLRMAALVTTAITATDAIIALDRRTTPGDDSGSSRSELGRITIPVGTAIGKVVWKEVGPVDLDAGDQLVVELIQASTAGAVVFNPLTIPRSESLLNQPDCIKSA